MKTTTEMLKRIAVISGFALGAFALSAVADSTWTEPSVSPPGGNPDPPLNVGSVTQTKAGGLTLGGLFTIGNLIFNPTGTVGAVATGSVMTAVDSNGTIKLVNTAYTCGANQALSSVSGSDFTCVNLPSGGTSSGTKTFTSGGTWTVPAGVTSVTVEAWGGGGGGGDANAGGGGAGGYAKGTFAVSAGDQYTIAVGGAGTGGYYTTQSIPGMTSALRCVMALGYTGGTSWFGGPGNPYISAFGGGGGISSNWNAANCAASASTGGGGGGFAVNAASGPTGVVGNNGGSGDPYVNSNTNGGSAYNGGGGAPSSYCANQSSSSVVNPGTAPGGGGCGTKSTSSGGVGLIGGDGAPGRVVLTW